MDQLNKSLDELIKDHKKERAQTRKQQRQQAAAKKRASDAPHKSKKEDSAGGIHSRLGGRPKRASAIAKSDIIGRLGPIKGAASTSVAGVASGRVVKRAASTGIITKAGRSAAAEKRVQNINIKGEAGPCTVFVANLDKGASSKDVEMCFKKYGEIRKCTILYDSNRRSTGKAEVVFAHKLDAEKAVKELDGVIADGARLSVQILSINPSAPATAATTSSTSAGPAASRGPRRKRGRGGARGGTTRSGKMYSDSMDVETKVPDPQFNVIM